MQYKQHNRTPFIRRMVTSVVHNPQKKKQMCGLLAPMPRPELTAQPLNTPSGVDPGSMKWGEGGYTVRGATPGRVREGGTPPAQLGGMGEHCKLPHWGLGRSPRSQHFLHYKTPRKQQPGDLLQTKVVPILFIYMLL